MPLLQLRTKTGARSLLIFIHGFGGSATSTWQKLASAFGASSLPGWDFYGFEYNSTSPLSAKPFALIHFLDPLRGLWESEPHISVVATQFKTELEELAMGCERVAIVAHSMGGLVAQRAILDSDLLRSLLISLVCFGTPSKGLVKASLLKRLKYQIDDMGESSTFIHTLRTNWSDAGFDESPPFHFKVVAGDKDDFVPASSSLSHFPTRFQCVIPGNHTSIIQPNALTMEIIGNSLIESNLIPNTKQPDVRRIILTLDREDPDSGIEKELQRREGSKSQRPYLFFFPAIADDLPNAYVDRLCLYTLPRIMRKPASRVSVTPLRWPSSASQSDVPSWLASVLGAALGRSATDVKEALRTHPKARLFCTDMTFTDVAEDRKSITGQFADFWRSLPDLNAPLFVVVCIRTEGAILDKSAVETLKAAVRFDEHLWGSFLPELDVLQPTYLETLDRHPLFLRLLAGRQHTLSHFQSTFESLAELRVSVRMRFLEESLSGNPRAGSLTRI